MYITKYYCAQQIYITKYHLFIYFYLNQAKGQEALDFVLTMIGRLEDSQHSQVLKEVLSLTNRYQPILTVTVINKLSALESDTASTASMRAYIQELRNDYNNKMSKERSSSNSGKCLFSKGRD